VIICIHVLTKNDLDLDQSEQPPPKSLAPLSLSEQLREATVRVHWTNRAGQGPTPLNGETEEK
jgi:hypothetical protein